MARGPIIDISTLSAEDAAKVLCEREKARARYWANKEACNARGRRYYYRNRETLLAKASEKYRSDVEVRNRKREQSRDSYERHRDEVLRRQKERETNLSTPGAIRQAVINRGEGELRAADIPDAVLGVFKYAILAKRELKKAAA